MYLCVRVFMILIIPYIITGIYVNLCVYVHIQYVVVIDNIPQVGYSTDFDSFFCFGSSAQYV
jgi:hypothetical protein